ncbi:hypothetical protein E0493_02215 [Roseomonas sp. M0104]|uniref:Uncharacterized protein n=1 Tax=Teichococcus coralli TaxID=2545983 RepID=A0A845B7U1_9PROT|nr:hypothetical protein [Pseudoroseomonas coralli]MXP62166.1 hypothetical protein [Pseudoroseomonas coralli]
MSDTPNRPPRERAIDPPPGPHAAPMPEKPLDATPARQGRTTGHVRWILLISIVLVILAFIVARLFSV